MHMPYPSFGQTERKQSRANSNYRIEISDQPQVIETDPIPVKEAVPVKLGESITFHPSDKETKGNESPDNSSGSQSPRIEIDTKTNSQIIPGEKQGQQRYHSPSSGPDSEINSRTSWVKSKGREFESVVG